MTNMKYICVFDFETLGLDWRKHDVVQIGAIMLEPRTLDVAKGGEFKSFVRPERPENAEAKALEVTGFNLDKLMEAPAANVVWPSFFDWIKSFNPKGTIFGAPIPCGYNIINFDCKFLNPQLRKYGHWNDDRDEQKILGFPTLDVMVHMWTWMESNADTKGVSLDAMRQYFGIDEVGHDALVDCYTTQKLLKRFLIWQRNLTTKHSLKGAFANAEVVQS